MPEPFALSMPDPRADGALRQVNLSPRVVTILRRYQGIAMRLVVPCSHYRGVTLRSVAQAGGLQHEVALTHADAELSIVLGLDAESPVAARLCAQWAAYFGLPALALPSICTKQIFAVAPRPRRRSATLAQRRRRYALRRKPGFVSLIGV